MAKKLVFTSSETAPVANSGLKLSKLIAIKHLEKHPQFEILYKIHPDVLERLTQDIKENGFNPAHPIIVWVVTDEDGTKHLYILDGYTRIKAAEAAGKDVVPYTEVKFDSYEEARLFAIKQQVNRRNASNSELLSTIEELMGSDYIQNHPGYYAEEIANTLGTSVSTAERTINVINKATPEQKADIDSGIKSINQVNNEIKQKEYVENNATEEQLEQIEAGETTYKEVFDDIKETKKTSKKKAEDDISEALEDTSGDPAAITVHQRKEDDTPHMAPPKESELDRWTIEKNLQIEAAVKEAHDKGLSEGFEKGFFFALGEINKGRTPQDVYNDERVADLSPTVISKFELPEDDENGGF